VKKGKKMRNKQTNRHEMKTITIRKLNSAELEKYQRNIMKRWGYTCMMG